MRTDPRTVRAALVQRACSASPADNLAACVDAIGQAGAAGAHLVILEELHNTLYFCQVEDPAYFDLAEPVPGPSTRILAEVARETGTVIVASLFERRAAGLYHNTAVVMDADGRLAGTYRKMHVPDDPGFYEKFFFTPGDQGFRPIDTAVGRLGVLVCWDQWFPEAARAMALAGAEVLIYPTAIGWDPRDHATERSRQLDAWTTVQRGHAVANALPVIACNRTGLEPDPAGQTAGIQFWGRSFVCGPQGEWLARADENEEILVTEIDLGKTESVRRMWPFLRDRRIDAYPDLLKRFAD
jgi:N-carbamoylputrescine amidase